MTRLVTCPTCQKRTEWSEDNPWRPFCSERCKLIDLGEWATENRRIPGPPHLPMDEDEPLG
ncbi:MAG: DNA gyrase inhibitor YacG [Pseudomonadota bacterium]